ncbi:Uma2 family endonuclease [Streptomyces sp. FH025]|uniref:Uma2 family endonuclease n=1 Tax=Streptomyces sp. FH025 TaxID=2815937 RepID=UPI001A9F133E|nr:Uma2 family endonuclease [Streptomyces sp. FH025]MBO1415757.1 Uma2 family endonuclease [Streptomyces sp. FH025]
MDIDQRLWEGWKAIAVPKNARAEIDEDVITITIFTSVRDAPVVGRLMVPLKRHLKGTGYRPVRGRHVIADRKAMKPDVLVVPDDTAEIEHPEGVGVMASGVPLVVEIVWPDDRDRRDQDLKPRAYAAAGIPVYVIIDDYDDGGVVTILTGPDPARGEYASSTRIPYGKEAVIPEGPAKGFVIGPEITGERRA